jgi:hypothetical protein
MVDTYCPKGRDNLLKRDLNDGTVLHDEKTSQIYTLNTTAALIWEYCDGKTSLKEITAELVDLCEKNPEELMQDVKSTIQDFQSKGLLEEEP